AGAASGGMAQLTVPVSVSGLGQNRLGTLRESLTRAGLGPAVLYAGSTATGAPAARPLVPGGNFAAALSYGDVTAAGIGTATLVCSGRALAFGHPFFLSGRTTMSAHLADALYVQPDALYGSYKVANVTGLVGTVDQDRATGLRAQLGAGPPTTVVTSHVAASGGLSRDGTTRVSQPSVVPGITRSHLLSNLNVVLQHIGEGTAQVSWTVTGTTTSGATWTLTDRNRVASPSDVTGAATEPLGWLETVRDNRFTDVTFSSIRLQASADDVYRQYSLDGVEVKVGDEYLPVDPMSPVVAAPGSTLALRAVLTPYRDRGTTRRVPFSFTVPAGLAGQTFGVELVGGASTSGPDPTQATSFADLLDRLRAQPQRDQVIARVYSGMGPAEEVGTASLDQVVSGSRFVSVQVTGAGTTR
ncbi:MAG TPA: hypothetical protein VKP11_02290, partial [Frankiaceae bacterium]|nr:hypothetical protein [Frankiaceae bacterium]